MVDEGGRTIYAGGDTRKGLVYTGLDSDRTANRVQVQLDPLLLIFSHHTNSRFLTSLHHDTLHAVNIVTNDCHVVVLSHGRAQRGDVVKHVRRGPVFPPNNEGGVSPPNASQA